MKIIKLYFLSVMIMFVHFVHGQTEEKFRKIEIPGNHAPIAGMALSPDQSLLAVAAVQGRFYLMDVRSQGSESLIWKRLDLSGFKYGARIRFTPDSKYVLLVEMKNFGSSFNPVKIKSRTILILDVLTGSTVFSRSGVFGADLMPDGQTVVFTQGDQIQIMNFLSGSTLRSIPLNDAEAVGVSNSGLLIAASYDPDRRELKQLESVDRNRGELRNAAKAKRLIAFFDAATGNRLYQSDDETDIVFNIQFSSDDREAIYMTRGKGKEGNQKQLTTFGFFRMDASSGKKDPDFFYSSNDFFGDYALTPDKTYFAYSDNMGFFKWKKRFQIFDYNRLNHRVAQFAYQGRIGSMNIFTPTFALRADRQVAYLSNGPSIIEWDYEKLPDHLTFVEKADPDETIDKASAVLEEEMRAGKLREFISKNAINGIFIFDITLHKKGEVATIFAPGDEKTDIRAQNLLKDFVRQMRFDVKIPKDQRVKFRYTFDISVEPDIETEEE